MTGEVIALSLTLLVHVLGAMVLIGVIARNSGADLWGWWPRDDDDGPGGPDVDPTPAEPSAGGGLPLPGGRQSGVRLRAPERLADGYPRPSRRPVHAPERVPARERESR